jgi:hypothetical protein
LGLGVVVSLVLAMTGPLPAKAAGGPGQSPNCAAQIISTSVTYDKPQARVDGQAAACYYSSGMPGQQYDQPPGRQAFVYHPPGTPCSRVIYAPNTFVVNADGSISEVTPPSEADAGGTFRWPTAFGNALGLLHVNMAETSNVYSPFLGTGKWDATGLVCQVPANGWEAGCTPPGPANIGGLPLDLLTIYTGLSSEECIHTTPNAVVGSSQATLPRLQADIGQVAGLIGPGTITSMPQQAGLVNTRTCFWVEPPADPARNAFNGRAFDILIAGQPDANGRIVFYTFRIKLSAPTITWSFNDGSTQDDGLAAQCQGQHPEAVLSAGHIYHNYNNSPGFSVTVQESYTLTIDEYWFDTQARGPVAIDPATVGQAPVVQLVAGPINQPVVQEEGVPVG